MSIRSLTFQVVAMMAIPAFAAYHESTAYDFTFSSFAREGEITLCTEGEAKGEYTLGQELSRTITWPNGRTSTLETPLFDKQVSLDALVGEGGLLEGEALRPISYVPNGLTVTAVSIVTPGDLAPETLTLTVGKKSYDFSRTGATEAVTLRGTWDGVAGTRSGTVHTYAPKGAAIALADAGTTFSVDFPATDASGQQQNRSIYLLDGAPFLRLFGTAKIKHHIFTIDQSAGTARQSLAELLKGDSFVDAANTVVVVDFKGAGGAIDLDTTIERSPLIFGSAVEPDQAAIHFLGGATVTSPLTFRDGATRGGVSVYGPDPTDDQPLTWDPAALLLLCDATLKTTLPTGEDGWFATHATAIPAGRTFRIELDEKADSDALPNLSFAAANSVLELALADNSNSLPTKYTSLMTMQSGTLVFDQDVSLPSLTLGGEGLETTLILREGQEGQARTYAFAGSRQLPGIATQGDGVTLIQKGGELTLGSASTGAAPFALGAADTAIEVRGGTMICATALEADTAGTNTALTVAKGATLHLAEGLLKGAADTTATLDLTVAGTLQLSEDLAMTPALRRTLTLAGGTIASTVSEEIRVTCGDGGTSDGEGLLDVVGGGTLTGSLVVDAAAGQGDLAIGADATLKTLRDFTGTVSGEGTLEAITGSLGEVILGDTWLTAAAGKRLGDVLTGWEVGDTAYAGAADFAGTIGFTAGTETAVKTLDFTDLDELTSLGVAFRINNHQHIVMRLDQYADAVIRWPDNPDGITLTLIESGAYGGELTLPHFPHTEGEENPGVKFEFASFDPSAPLGYTIRQGGYTHGHTEDGVNDTLTWDNPVFTGEGAWIDVEFESADGSYTSANTGWFNLGAQNENGCLVGLPNENDNPNGSYFSDYGKVTTDPSRFKQMGHPVSGGMILGYRPYVAPDALPSFPEEWSLAVRLTAPSKENACILAIGHNYKSGNASDKTYALVFATGAVETDGTTEIVLWKFDGMSTDGAKLGEEAQDDLFRVKVAAAQDAPHVFSVVCDGETLNLYMDGAWLNAVDVPNQALSGGLQVGQQLGGSAIPSDIRGKGGNVMPSDGGAVDYIRFYKGAFPETAMVEMADRTPYVRENLRYVRYVPISTDPRFVAGDSNLAAPEGGETWRQPGAWQEETWDGSAWTATGTYADEPAEGAYLRLLVAPGDHALQVNVERRVDEQAKDYFYSPDRNYAALVVEPQEGNAAAGTLRLVPYGVDPAAIADKTGDALTQAVDDAVPGSAWFTTPAGLSDANNTGFQYGKLRFTGGAYDPITDGDPTATNFYGSAYLIPGGTTVTEEVGTITWDENSIERDFGWTGNSGTFTQTGTRTLTYTYSANANQAVRLIFDGGVSYFSKYADVVLPAVPTGTQTVTETWQRTGTTTRSGSIFSGYTYEDDTEGAKEERQSIGTPTGELTGQEQVNTLQAVAGMALTRGVMDEVARWQLTGPVVVQGTAEPGRDYVLGHPELKTQDPNNDQASEDVWVPFFTANSTWKFYDDTRVEGGAENADGALGAGEVGEDATRGGLFARGVQTPGRLYLDFTVGVGTGDAPGTAEDTAKDNTGNFSEQAWYRYGYEGNQTTATLSGMSPERAKPEDFDQAVAFQIRLSEKTGDVTLTLDDVPTARVQVFYVEEEAGAQKALTLKLKRNDGVEALKVWKSVVAAARLDVSNNNTGVASADSWKGNALNLRPADGIRTPVQRGNATHGHGAFIVGATEVDWDFGAASSVPRLEVIPGAELTFTVGQDFRRQDLGGITLVAQGKETSTFPKPDGSDAGPTEEDLTSAAWIHHRSAEPFLGQDVELGEGAIFGFHAEAASSNADVQNEGVVLSGELRLTGNATLRADFESASGGAGAARLPHFVAAGGIRATKQGLTLIVDAPTHQGGQGGAVDWHCHTANLTGEDDFRLWKTGPGTMTFYATTPPSVTGKVTVEEGTLAVTAAANTPVGAKGLHVKKDATLADSGRMSGANLRLALIPDGATLSGGGTVAGRLGLKGGATYLAKQGEALTATGGIFTDDSLEADIAVSLPGDYEAGTPYLVANREERDVRRRLLPKKGGEWWDAIAWIDTGAAGTATSYAARPPQFPAPTDYDGYKPGTSPTTITGTIEKPLINQYQNAGHAYVGQTFGRTRAGNKKLNPTELSDALLCFTNISAFVEDVGVSGTREYVDGTNFYVGYEFGVSQMAFAQVAGAGTDYVVLEVSVESALEDSFPGVGFNDVQRNFEADFNSATELSFDLIDAAGDAHPLGEGGLGITVEEVTGMDGTPIAPGKRWFRIPYQDLLDCELVKEDGNIRLRATATSPYARRP